MRSAAVFIPTIAPALSIVTMASNAQSRTASRSIDRSHSTGGGALVAQRGERIDMESRARREGRAGEHHDGGGGSGAGKRREIGRRGVIERSGERTSGKESHDAAASEPGCRPAQAVGGRQHEEVGVARAQGETY